MTQKTIRKEEQYRSIIEHSQDPIFVSNDTGILYINQSGAEFLDLNSPEELLGKKAVNFIHPEYREKSIEYAQNRRSGKKAPEKYRLKIIQKNGHIKDVEFYVKVIVWDGAPASLIFARDISEQIDFEEKIKYLYENADQLSKATSIKEILIIHNRIAKEIIGFYGSTSFGYIKNNKLIFEPVKLEKPIILDLDGKGITVRAVRTGQVQNVPDVKLDPDFVYGPPRKLFDTKSALAIPVIFDEKVIGVINISSETQHKFSEHEIQLVKLLGTHMGLAFSRIRKEEYEREYQKKIRAFIRSRK